MFFVTLGEGKLLCHELFKKCKIDAIMPFKMKQKARGGRLNYG